jgi:hypothetical protein
MQRSLALAGGAGGGKAGNDSEDSNDSDDSSSSVDSNGDPLWEGTIPQGISQAEKERLMKIFSLIHEGGSADGPADASAAADSTGAGSKEGAEGAEGTADGVQDKFSVR